MSEIQEASIAEALEKVSTAMEYIGQALEHLGEQRHQLKLRRVENLAVETWMREIGSQKPSLALEINLFWPAPFVAMTMNVRWRMLSICWEIRLQTD